MNINTIKSIHFVGIGGISQSALALMMTKLNKKVSGTDDNIDNNVFILKQHNIEIYEKTPESVIENADLIVYTNAVSKTHHDLVLATKFNKPILERAEFLGLFSSLFTECIAVAGTHGKTTTTALCYQAMQTKNPTLHLGGVLKNIQSNQILGGKRFFITEACEFNKSFLHLKPTVSIITNVEKEHMNTFKTIENLFASFIQFAKQTTDLVIVESQSEIYNKLKTQNLTAKLGTVALNSPADLYASNIHISNGKTEFECFYHGKKLGETAINSILEHDVKNCLFAIYTALFYNIDFDTIKQGILTFNGVKRRFEVLFEKPKIIHDYAHHPTEIIDTIKATKQLSTQNIVCVFQPHTFSRTKTLMPEFKNCFSDVDKLILLPTYKAREKSIYGGRSIDLYNEIKDIINTSYIKSKQELFKYLLTINDNKQTTFLFLGAGSIGNFAKDFVSTIQNKRKSPIF